MRGDDAVRLYAWLGRALAPVTAPDSPYRDRVQAYADAGFERSALEDRLGGDPAVVARHYRTAMRLELAFFAAAHEQAR